MDRKRGATAESHGISSERQRSMATRRFRRNATQAGQASMCPRISSQLRGSTLPSKYSEKFENSSRHSVGRCPPLVRRPQTSSRALSVSRLIWCVLQHPIHLFAYREACPMEANPDRPGCKSRICATCSVVNSSMSWSTRTMRSWTGYAKPPDAIGSAARRGVDCLQDSRRHPATIAQFGLVGHQFIQ